MTRKPRIIAPLEVRKWMLDQGLWQALIHRETGASESSVSKTIKGERGDSRVIAWLRGRGCPEEFISAAERQAA